MQQSSHLLSQVRARFLIVQQKIVRTEIITAEKYCISGVKEISSAVIQLMLVLINLP